MDIGSFNLDRWNQMQAYRDTFEQQSGYQVVLSDQQLFDLAKQHPDVQSQFDFGQTVMKLGTAISNETQPWAFMGMTKDEYQARSDQLSAVYKDVTGQQATPDVVRNALVSGGGVLSASDFRSNLMNDTSMQNTYGWLKFGLNYQQFQQQKADYRTSFGQDISDDQAINQLKYDHALGHVLGAYQTAQLQPESQTQQQQPQATPSAGLAGSAVR